MGEEIDRQLQEDARLTFDQHSRTSAGCCPWPVGPRLEAGLAAGWATCEVHFVGRGGPQGHVRPVAVVPCNSELHVAVKRAARLSPS